MKLWWSPTEKVNGVGKNFSGQKGVTPASSRSQKTASSELRDAPLPRKKSGGVPNKGRQRKTTQEVRDAPMDEMKVGNYNHSGNG